jgi:flagellar secretion chaperone FliS
MAYLPHAAYAQNEIMHASPERLVQLLYELGIQSVMRARDCNRRNDIAGRVKHINKAFAVLVELGDGLDFDAGGEIAANYARIYDYCRRRLTEANARQSDEILAEVETLLKDLEEAWQVVVTKVGADRTARLLAPDILPTEQAQAGSISYVG